MTRIVGIFYSQFLYTDKIASTKLITLTLIAGVGCLTCGCEVWG